MLSRASFASLLSRSRSARVIFGSGLSRACSRALMKQQRGQVGGADGRVEPGGEVARRQEQGHPLVDGGHDGVGCRGEQGAGVALPEAGRGQQGAVGPAEVESLLAPAGELLPLIEAVQRHRAAPPPQGVPEGRPVRRRLGAGVDLASSSFCRLAREKDQAVMNSTTATAPRPMAMPQKRAFPREGVSKSGPSSSARRRA
jgi:hypothetical protein